MQRTFFAIVFGLLLLVSCNPFEQEDKYVDATVSEAISGSVKSDTHTYRLTDPEIVAVEKDYALLREGNQFQIVTCDGFEDSLAAIGDGPPVLLVKNWANPYPHFRLRAFEVNGNPRPVSFVLAESELPLLMNRSVYDLSFYKPVDLRSWKEDPPAADMVDQQILIRGHVEHRPAQADSAAAESPADTLEEAGADTYLIFADSVRVELAPIAENGVKLLLDGIAEAGATAKFGGFMTEVNRSAVRVSTGSYGTFQLSNFDFGGKICILR